ncbi:hypothetical protein CCAX7_37060 [Capsulimonas corticalis]|uniref:Uncharacterized protein n=1 Tax=Capsulimonas corticalis TaxID=2219043 RepID=A0A402D166_9BACT|nr:hypothetical protein [Capsulimonas corticalis]BDI31655.1 hypothetical protein CCAX7_37060 [Capsulimonas corticalis]
MDNNFVTQDQAMAAQAQASDPDIWEWETGEAGRVRGNWLVNAYVGGLFAVAAVTHILSTLALK